MLQPALWLSLCDVWLLCANAQVESLACSAEKFESALTDAFNRTDEEFGKADNAALVGTTAVVALVGSRQLYVANCGARPEPGADAHISVVVALLCAATSVAVCSVLDRVLTPDMCVLPCQATRARCCAGAASRSR